MQQLTQRWIIFGGVQGVGFRFFTYKKARSLGLTGYVRNLTDGSVEVVASGTASQLATFANFLQSGIPSATVKEILATPCNGDLVFSDFIVRR